MMASAFPFSSMTAARLAVPPKPGETHRWLAQVAGGLKRVLSPERCADFLRRCCDAHVAHRDVPDREIDGAVELAYGGRDAGTAGNYGQRPIRWPAAKAAVIGKVFERYEPLFDGERDSGLQARDVLPGLFQPGELVCAGADCQSARVRPVEDVLVDAEGLQFICVNPMRGALAINNAGRPSARCQNNVMSRRYLVAEVDDATVTKRQQAQLATALGDMAPLVMAVDSGGKSVHAWYAVEAMSRQDQAKFFAVACLLGADPTRWDVSGWLRMPGGLRQRPDGSRVRQRILYWDPEAIVPPEATKGMESNGE